MNRAVRLIAALALVLVAATACAGAPQTVQTPPTAGPGPGPGEGTVELKLSVDDKGNVTNSVVTKSSGYPALDESARQESLKWKYSPARKNGKPVPYEWTVLVKFKLSDGKPDITPPPSQ